MLLLPSGCCGKRRWKGAPIARARQPPRGAAAATPRAVGSRAFDRLHCLLPEFSCFDWVIAGEGLSGRNVPGEIAEWTPADLTLAGPLPILSATSER